MTKCIVCENTKNFSTKYKILTKCNVCNHIFADLSLNFDEVKKIYSNKYFFGEEYIDYIKDRKQIEKNSIIKFKIISKYLKNASEFNLLEIGCAYGYFLNIIQKKFKKVFGIDINDDAILYARNKLSLEVQNTDFLQLSKNTVNNYNIFCMFDVIEHLTNPALIIDQINQYSKKGSYLFITTGDISSINAKINGANWRLIHPPSHVHYFSRKSITLLLEKNGFEVINITTCGYYRNLNFILNKIQFIKKYFNFFIKILYKMNLLNIDLYLNLYDIMFVIAKKK